MDKEQLLNYINTMMIEMTEEQLRLLYRMALSIS